MKVNFINLQYFVLMFKILSLGKSPISILQNPKWDLETHPHLDPSGQNNMNRDRKVKLTNVQFAEQRLKNVNKIFRKTKSYLYCLLSYIESKQLSNNINVSVQRGLKKKGAKGGVEYQLNDAFSVLDNVSNTPR